MNPSGTIAGRGTALLVVALASTLSAADAQRLRRSPEIRATTAGCVPPPSGLVAWMPGDGNAQDILDNAYDISITGATFPAGVVAQAFNFDGTGAAAYANINAGSAYTVDFWLRPSRSVGYEHLVSNDYVDSPQKYGALFFVNDRVEYWQAGNFKTGSASGSVPVDTYTHVALTYDGSVNRIYVNGNLVGTSGAHTEMFNNPVAFGFSIRPSDGRFAGQLDEVEIFNRPLSLAEIQAIVNAGSMGQCKTLVDSDGDGIVNSRDACPNTPPGTPVNASGCPSSACFGPPANLTNWFAGDGSVQDITNAANVDSILGTVTFPTGVIGPAMSFDGNSDVIYSTINAGSAYTVDFWVRPTRQGAFENLLANDYPDGTTQPFGAIFFVNDRIEYWQGGGFRVSTGAGSVPLNSYVHVALTYDGQVNRLYLNGNLFGTSAVHTGETFNNRVRLAYSVVPRDSRFAGQLDEVEIFNRPLAQTEIRGIVSAALGKCKTVVDADGDGVVDILDACPNTPPGTSVNASGCPLNACFAPPVNLTNWMAGDGSLQDIRSGANVETIVGTFTFPAGVVGQAMNFDGMSDVIYSTINAGSTYTLDFWMRPTRQIGYENLVAYDFSDATTQPYGALYFINDRVEYWQGGVLRVGSTGFTTVPLNSYTHVALSYDGQVNRLFLNGNLVGTSPVHTGETFNNLVRLGYSVARFNARFAGQLDEVEFFNRTLAQKEIRGIYHAGSLGKCKTMVDSDGDGVVDNLDACPNTSPSTTVNASGCPLNTCFPPPSGLLHWFTGDGNANDRVGTNSGTLNGGVSFPASQVAQGFNFDGTGDVTYAAINAGAAYTVDFWMRPTRQFSYEHLVSNDYRDGTQNYGDLYFNNDHVEYWQLGSLRAGSDAGNVGAILLNAWAHVALTYDGDRNRLYVNGSLVATSNSHAGETFNNQIRLASNLISADARFAGGLDEVEIFNRALSQTELRGIYHAGSVGQCKDGVLPLVSPRIIAITRTNGTVLLQGAGGPSTQYAIERSLTPAGNSFSFFGTTISTAAGNWSLTDATTAGETRVFYRAKLP